MSSVSENERKTLERKAKAGWASFYAMKDRADDLGNWVRELKSKNDEMVRKLRADEYEMNTLDITYLKNQFLEMYDRLKLETECPICLETLIKDNTKLSNCGHLHCLTCWEKIDKCSICRKTIWKPRPIPN